MAYSIKVKDNPDAKKLRRTIIRCERCELSSRPGIRPVPFRGPLNARIAIVGEAPGEQENGEGRPFVGASGRLMSKLLKTNGVDLDDCFILNTVSCWPGGKPKVEHIKACRIHLKRQLQLCSAEWVLVLGAVALGYFDPDRSVLAARGSHWRWRDRQVCVTVHPAYALRNPEGHALLERDIQKFARLWARTD